MSFDTDENDINGVVFTSSILVNLDGYPVGCIQQLKLEANCKEDLPQLEFTFPDLEKLEYDKSVYAAENRNRPEIIFIKDIRANIRDLQKAINIKINKQSIDTGEPIIMLNEVGTDGFIDSIPMEKRHK